MLVTAAVVRWDCVLFFFMGTATIESYTG